MVKQRKEIATMGNQVWFAIVVGFFTSVYRSLSFFCVFTKKLSVLLYFFYFSFDVCFVLLFVGTNAMQNLYILWFFDLLRGASIHNGLLFSIKIDLRFLFIIKFNDRNKNIYFLFRFLNRNDDAKQLL